VPGSTEKRARKYGRIMPYFTAICGKKRARKYGRCRVGEQKCPEKNVPGSTVHFLALID
jgi:hypothetical protein